MNPPEETPTPLGAAGRTGSSERRVFQLAGDHAPEHLVAGSPADADPRAGATKKGDITRGVFVAVDLRVGRVVAVDHVDGAPVDLWRLTVDFGALGALVADVRLPGRAPPDVLDQPIVAAVNLHPRHAGGLRREFVPLLGTDPHGRTLLIGPDGPAAPGTPIG